MELSTLVPLSVHVSPELCKLDRGGAGVAVCQDVLVISSVNKLQVFALPEDIVRGDLGTPRELTHVRTPPRPWSFSLLISPGSWPSMKPLPPAAASC